jgi:hypothetical protein
MVTCGIRFCAEHARALMKANQERRGRILVSLGYRPAATAP